MIRTLLVGASLAVGLWFAAADPAEATTMVPMSVEQMTDNADYVVRGTIVEVWSERDTERGHIFTRAQVEVSTVFKGELASQALVIEQVGGVVASDYELVSLAARFSVGEEAFFFLEELRPGHLSVVGMYQGKFTVRMDPDTGDEMVVRYTVPQDAWYDHNFIPHPAREQRVAASDFERVVTRRLEQGWDGQVLPGADPNKLRRINKLQPGVK